jgi:CheY-like chemotaxis protein
MAEAAVSRILLVGGGPDAARLAATMETATGRRWQAERVDSPEAALLRLGGPGGGFDMTVLDLDAFPPAEGIAVIRRLREAAPAVPLVAVTLDADDARSGAALHAGAEDCVRFGGADFGDADEAAFRRAVRHALERSRYQSKLDERREFAAREREIGGLAALGGRAVLPVSGRSFGVVPLIERAPQDFSDLVIRYTGLLDLALEERTVRMESRIGEELSAFADRIGILGAGPRDLVDIHKAAITGRLEGQSLRRARAYVEEGRLLLLQVMGYLVTFYRNLSWGRGSTGRPTPVRDEPQPLGETPNGKGER